MKNFMENVKNVVKKAATGIAVAVLGVAMAASPAYAAEKFSDVPDGVWYEQSVETLASYGIISGYGDGSFRPNQKLTEAEALTMFFNSSQYFAVGKLPEATPENGVPSGKWFSNAIGGLQQADVLNRSIAVNGPISRANFTVLAARTLGYQEVDSNMATLATSLYSDVNGFTEEQKYAAVVTNNEGVVFGRGNGVFGTETLSRAEAAAIIYRMMDAKGVITFSDDNSITVDDLTVEQEPQTKPVTKPTAGDDNDNDDDEKVIVIVVPDWTDKVEDEDIPVDIEAKPTPKPSVEPEEEDTKVENIVVVVPDEIPSTDVTAEDNTDEYSTNTGNSIGFVTDDVFGDAPEKEETAKPADKETDATGKADKEADTNNSATPDNVVEDVAEADKNQEETDFAEPEQENNESSATEPVEEEVAVEDEVVIEINSVESTPTTGAEASFEIEYVENMGDAPAFFMF